MKKQVLVLVSLVLILLTACKQQANIEEPPTILYGQDVCDRCGMIISEETYAAAYWTKDGDARRFDDIGGMLAYIAEEQEEIASHWVHDFPSGEWIRAEEATFLIDSDLKTPMGFGIAAFADEEQAVAMAHGREDVMIVPFAQMMAMDITMPIASLRLNNHKMGEGGQAHKE